MSKRFAFLMKLKPECEDEYKKRHDKIWPELVELLQGAGISDYSIFLDSGTLTLFALLHLSDNNTLGDLPNQPLMRKWWDYMADLMETNPDRSPVVTAIQEVFHMD